MGGRLCRVPPGSNLSFEYDLEARRLKIRFGGDEEPVVVNTRTGKPVSGSERTVPQLYLWKLLAGRPFTDTWQQMVEMDKGMKDERGRTLTTVPAVINQRTQQRPHGGASTGDLSVGNLWIWFAGVGSLLAVLLGGLWFRYRTMRRCD